MERLAQEAIRLAIHNSASDAECTFNSGERLTVAVRMREVDRIHEAISRGAGIRVLKGTRAGSATTNDLSPEGVRLMVERALGIASVASEDPFVGLPEPAELGKCSADLKLYSEDVARLSIESKIVQARAAEEAALQLDPRIVGSDGSSFDTYLGHQVFANSRGFCGSYRTSHCSLSVVPVARQNGSMERDLCYSSSRAAATLDRPEVVGRIAAERSLRRLNPRKILSEQLPVVFEPRAACTLVSHLFDAINGSAVCNNRSFLAGRLGERVASELLTVIDDGVSAGLLGSSPFDDEGVPSGRTVLIERGVLESYLLNSYSARKLGLKTTGNARRGLAGNAGVGHGNLFIAPPGATANSELPDSASIGRRVSDEFPPPLPASLPRAILVTGLIGHGVNTLTGDYSQSAVGFWIEDGEIIYPVSEVILSGKLQRMLMSIEWVGSDLAFHSSLASPTLMIGQMTICGR
jgi:PmbA protein